MTNQKLNKMFPTIIRTCRADLLAEGYPEKDVEKLIDEDMKYIADKLVDSLMNSYLKHREQILVKMKIYRQKNKKS